MAKPLIYRKKIDFLTSTAFLLFCLFFLLTGIRPAHAHPSTVKIATGEWPPYISKNLKNFGFLGEVITEVFIEMDMSPELEFYPWRRCCEMVKTGRILAAFPYSMTEERLGEVWFSDKLSFSVTRLFYVPGKEKKISYSAEEDLKKYTLGGVIGYFYEERFNRLGLKVDYSARERHALEKLLVGRIDLLPLNEMVGWYLIGKHFTERQVRFAVLEKPYSIDNLYLIISRNYPGSEKILENFNEALEKVKDRMIYQNHLNQYQ